MTSARMPKEKSNPRSRMLMMAMGMGLLASFIAYIWLQKLAGGAAAGHAVPTLPVVVAAHDIPARTLVTKELLQVRSVAVGNAPAEAVAAPTDLIGKVTTVPIIAGSPLTQHMVAARDINMGMAYALPPSTRAISIPLDPVAGVAGFIKPGDHVDVLTTFVDSGGATVARTVLQNIMLLATGTHVLPGYTPASKEGTGAPPPVENGANAAVKPEEMPNATLMVTPDEAQVVMLAAARGKLQLILRPADDPSRSPIVPTVSEANGPTGALNPQATSGLVLPAALPSSSHAKKARPAAPQVTASARRSEAPALKGRPRQARTLEANAQDAPPSPAGEQLRAQPSPVGAQPLPQTPHEERQATLTGVMPGQDACAILNIGDTHLLREIGDVVAGCKIVRVFDRGIFVQAPGHAAERWLIGDSRRMPELQP